MNIKNIKAFTFVELIVVITILVILSVIWLWAYQSYLWDSRDTNRLLQMSEMYEGMYTYSISSKLPYPEEMIEIQASGNTFAYQWYAGENTIKIVWYDGGWKDIEYDTYLTYMLSNNGRDFQLMTYTDDRDLLGNFVTSQWYAAQDYSSMFPKVLGSPLGVLVDEGSNAPIQSIEAYKISGVYDVVSGSESIISYLSDDNRLSTNQWDNISLIIPDISCERILELGNSKWNWKYVISLAGSTKTQVYCDMETEGWWWTFAWFIDGSTRTSEIRFKTWTWVYDSNRTDSWEEYFIAMDWLWHEEMMALIDTSDPVIANENDRFLLLRYWLDAEMFHTDDLMNCSDNFWKSDGFFHQMYLWSEPIWSNVWSCDSNWWWLRPKVYNPGWTYLLRTRDSGWSTFGTEWRPQAWDPTGLGSQWFGHSVWFYVR